MNPATLKNIIESMIMVADAPITIEKLNQTIDEVDVKNADIKLSLEQLKLDYQNRGIELIEVSSGFRFQACSLYQEWFHRLLQEKPQRYSKALLETLAIIAYRQPVTRADVESIRGVAVSTSIMKTLLEREWVRVVGHRDVPGKPSIYSTTKIFLDYFGLKSLGELPPLNEVKDLASLMKQGDKLINNSEEILANLQAQSVDDEKKIQAEDKNVELIACKKDDEHHDEAIK